MLLILQILFCGFTVVLPDLQVNSKKSKQGIVVSQLQIEKFSTFF